MTANLSIPLKKGDFCTKLTLPTVGSDSFYFQFKPTIWAPS